uniref:Thiamine biosynthesis protein n=1 Tax=Chaetoceros curvisetus TaxID=230516 RepID=A0A8F5JA89_9STRA|nr:Thiamine biosynthesis protein [Chaetoceros curvisetus]
MTNRITFFFNGEKYFTDKTITLLELLDYFNYQSSLFVLEYNHFICNKKKWKETQIQKNDQIEIITIVGGG